MTDYSSKLPELTLGKVTQYEAHYSPELLDAVPRSLNREPIGINEALPFHGVDVWHGYELSWLNAKGKPVVGLMRCQVPATTPNIVESKSFKLYLNSFNQTRFDSHQAVQETMVKDLSATAGGTVSIELFQPQDVESLKASALAGDCIDGLDIEIKEYKLESTVLATSDNTVSETLHSHLLKSNCLITNQPDWASVIIEYTGKKIDQESLLRYLISFRQHNEFHEQCVERIFVDITKHCKPDSLTVQALYTRRGGLDICPFRSSDKNAVVPFRRINRQ